MIILVNNKIAALKKDTSFEYISENRLFSGSDGYTLTITFPLKDCIPNLAIFGHINRADVSTRKVIFDCEIRDRNFYKFGCLTVVEINESEVKTQFLDGRSEQNFDVTFDSIYINELDLGSPEITSAASITPGSAWSYSTDRQYVALPWVNDSTGNMQNYPVENGNSGTWKWHADTKGLSWQPYLIYIARQICSAVGYSCEFSVWESISDFKYLLVCNTLPYSWHAPQFAAALPHWTVEEFFSKLELLMSCEFDIDHRAKRISMNLSKNVVNSKQPIVIDNVVDEHSIEVSIEDDKCDYSETKNISYKDCEHNMSKFYSCDWFIKAYKDTAVVYDTLSGLLAANRGLATWNGSNMRGSNMNNLLYAADVNTYFVVRTISRVGTVQRKLGGEVIVWQYKCALQPVNVLGPRIVDDSDGASTEEIEFVPACIDYTDDDNGWCLFLSFNGYDEETNYIERQGFQNYDDHIEEMNSRFAQTTMVQSIEAGESEGRAEYYDKIYIAWWDGAANAGSHKLPFPHVHDVVINDDWSGYYHPQFSLRLNDKLLDRFHFAYPIDKTKKYTFKFLADKLPDVRTLYYIRGKRYVCEKLTATFTDAGMSQLVKGEFYEVVEST